MDKIEANIICQVGIIVKDVEKTARNYAELFRMEMPSFIVTDPEEEAHTKYRGKGTKARAKLAFFSMRALELELIEPVDGPSTWKEFLDTQGEGLHHIAFRIKGMDNVIRLLGDKGMPLVQKGDYPGGRYAYIDSIPQLGIILELLEND